MKLRLHLPFFLCGLVIAAPAAADIYKCVDSEGHVTYTNDKPASGMKCTLMSRDQPVTTVSLPKPPANFPKVDEGTQRARDNDRRAILEQELASEQKSLEAARAVLVEQEAVRNGNERNYQNYLDRLQPFKDKVALHERNIEAIRKELGGLK